MLRPCLPVAITMVGALVVGGCSAGSHEASSSTAQASKDARSTSSAASSVNPDAAGPERKSSGSITILASGDEIPHAVMNSFALRRGGGNSYEYDSTFAPIKKVVSADIAICQLETTISPNDSNLTDSGVSFSAPRAFARAIKDAGYDGCSTANNHAYDRSLSGLQATDKELDRVGLKASGPGPSSTDPQKIGWYDVKGFKVAHLSYSYSLENLSGEAMTRGPASAPWLARSLWAARKASGIESDARAARAKGADLVLVSLHWGAMFQFQPNAEQRSLAQEIAKSNTVDWIIGNHPHVVQPCARIGSTLVNYSLGNQVSAQGPNVIVDGSPMLPQTQDGVIVETTFTRDAAGKVTGSMKYLPTWVDQAAGYAVKPVTKESNPRSWERTTSLIEGDGNGCKVTPMN